MASYHTSLSPRALGLGGRLQTLYPSPINEVLEVWVSPEGHESRAPELCEKPVTAQQLASASQRGRPQLLLCAFASSGGIAPKPADAPGLHVLLAADIACGPAQIVGRTRAIVHDGFPPIGVVNTNA